MLVSPGRCDGVASRSPRLLALSITLTGMPVAIVGAIDGSCAVIRSDRERRVADIVLAKPIASISLIDLFTWKFVPKVAERSPEEMRMSHDVVHNETQSRFEL